MSNELIKLDESLPAELQEEITKELDTSLNQMMGGIDVRPIKIKIAAGGSNNWLIGDDETAKKSFRAIIIANIKANAYWHKADNVANPVLIDTMPEDYDPNIPLCSSMDGILGSISAQTAKADGREVTCFGDCGSCYLNQYKTAVSEAGERGKGKACKNGRRMVVLVDGSDVPHVITLPPTSIKNFDGYITKLRGKKTAAWIVWTTFNLESKQDGQRKWSVFTPGQEERIPDELVPDVYKFKKQFEAAVGIEITPDEFEGGNGQPEEVEAEVVTDKDGNTLNF
jgi:hypothetical protein